MSSISAIQACIGSSTAGKPADEIIEILDRISSAVVQLRAQNAELEHIRTLSLIHLTQFRDDYDVLEASFQHLRTQYQSSQTTVTNRLISRPMRFRAQGDTVNLVFTLRTNSPVGSINFSRDGSSFGFSDGIHFFSVAETGGLLREIPLPNKTDFVRAVAYSRNNEKVALACADGTIDLIDLESGDVRELRGHEGEVSAIEFGSDNAVLFTGGYDGKFITWDVATGEQKMVEKFGDAGDATNVIVGLQVFESFVVVVCMEGALRVYEGGVSVRAGSVAHDGFVIGMKLSNDGKMIVTVGEDKLVKLWNFENLELIATLEGHKNLVVAGSFSGDDSVLITGSRDQTARAWNLSGERKQMMEISGFSNTVVDVAHHPTRQCFVTACGDGTVSLWSYGSE